MEEAYRPSGAELRALRLAWRFQGADNCGWSGELRETSAAAQADCDAHVCYRVLGGHPWVFRLAVPTVRR